MCFKKQINNELIFMTINSHELRELCVHLPLRVVVLFLQLYFPTQLGLSIQVAAGEIPIEFVIIIFGS